jgi:teichuronic acid biosynthesis glycosyltransferase TuaC
MHVLTLTPFYPAAADDAAGCFIAESVSALERREIESSVIAVHPMHRVQTAIAVGAPPATRQSYFSFPGNAGLASAGWFLHAALKHRVRQLHARQPIDLIHAHAALPCGQAAVLLARELDIPFVVTVHGLDAFATRQVPGWFGRRCSKASARVYRTAARVICISEHVAQRVRNGLSTAHTSVVYNGVDPLLFSPLDRETPAGQVVLSVGNLIPIKGHELLLRAVAAITAIHPQVECKIIGDGPERDRLQLLARHLRIHDRVHFLGRKSRTEVAVAMQECTLFALPSWYEGLGCVYLEAMASEAPAIACHGQGIAEIIRNGENGWLIEPHNLSDLTAALGTLLSDQSLREKLGRNGRQTILQSHTLAHQATQLVSLYRELLQ